MPESSRVAIVGAGSWGTALANLLTHNGQHLHWWVRSEENANHIRTWHHNPSYLGYLELLTGRMAITTNIAEAVGNADIIILAVPAAFLESSLSALPAGSFGGRMVVSAIKGIVPGSNQLIGDYLATRFGLQPQQFGVIAGPCHSEEIAMEKQSYLTLALPDENAARPLMRLLANRFVKVSWLADVTGIEYASVLKNIYALANGIAIGLGYGDNFQAVLISNALMEMGHFLKRINSPECVTGRSPYAGDLLVTAYSSFSRNRTFGTMIGKGYGVDFVKTEMKMVAEGYYAVHGIASITGSLGIGLPIVETVHNILYLGHPAQTEMKVLAQKLK
jgi:glycerol-3-phosphate dehydrogenase (NAD(P)+)